MSVQTYNDLADHFGHTVSVVMYGEGANVAIECEDCYEVLLDFDKGE